MESIVRYRTPVIGIRRQGRRAGQRFASGWVMACLVTTLAILGGGGCSRESESEEAATTNATVGTRLRDRSSLTNEVAPTITAWPDAKLTGDDPLAWNRRTLADAYRKHGRKGEAWDDAALEALEAFAQQRAKTGMTNAAERMASFTRKAIEAGCPDPMINYLGLRVLHGGWDEADKARAQRYREVAEALDGSEYPAIRKFYAWLRASQAWKAAHEEVSQAGREYGPMRRAAFRSLTGVLQGADTPEVEAFEALAELENVIASHSSQEDEFLPTAIDYLDQRWPGNARALALSGRFHGTLAWNRRGSKYADQVTDAGWAGFESHLNQAEADLEASWKRDPTQVETAISMMRVELGQGRGRMRMEMWFDRAMKLDPASFNAAYQKAWYLQPKWHGSKAEALAFGRRCVASKEWRGTVPLILVEVHLLLASDSANGLKEEHWTQPGVWEDVRSSYERFFELNPDAVRWRSLYAKYAYKCRQFGPFLDQVSLSREADEELLGGREALEQMIQTAERATGRKGERPRAGAAP